MIANLPVAIVVGVMVACGVVLLLERGIVRSFIGYMLMGNAVNIMFMAAGGTAGAPPLLGSAAPEDMSDPLPHAMVLTSIVITLALSGFVMALAHRAWQVSDTDVILDDDEDARIARMAAENDLSDSDYEGDDDVPDPGDDPDPGGHHSTAQPVPDPLPISDPDGDPGVDPTREARRVPDSEPYGEPGGRAKRGDR